MSVSKLRGYLCGWRQAAGWYAPVERRFVHVPSVPNTVEVILQLHLGPHALRGWPRRRRPDSCQRLVDEDQLVVFAIQIQPNSSLSHVYFFCVIRRLLVLLKFRCSPSFAREYVFLTHFSAFLRFPSLFPAFCRDRAYKLN